MKQKSFIGLTAAVVILIAGILLINHDAKAFIINNLRQIGLIKSEITTETSSPAQTSESQNTAAANIEGEAPLAPSVIFKDGTGKTVDISKQRGKVVFINFWATWCPPCIAEMPSINKLRSELNKEDIIFLMVDVDDNYKKSSQFMERKKYDLPVYTPGGAIPEQFLSGSIPTTVVIDKEGRVVARHEGGADYSHPDVVKFFKDLIAK